QQISHAEFRIEGAENHPEWFVTVVAYPGATAIGDLFGAGLSVGFPACMPSANGILLVTVQILPFAPIPRAIWRIAAPAQSLIPCASVTTCDAPPRIEATESYVFFASSNDCASDDPGFSTCTVGVEARAWTDVKSLYR